jgi:predicted NBD/HSP70 family sugar kinase
MPKMPSSVNKHGTDLVRDYHLKLIYNLVRISKTLSRADLTRMTKLSPTSIGKIVGVLIAKGLVVEVGTSKDGKIGRDAKLLSIIPNGKLAIGVSIDVNHIEAGIVNIAGEVLTYVDCFIPTGITQAQVLPKLLNVITDLQQQLDAQQKERVAGIGVRVPGVVSWTEGVVTFSPQFGWKEFALGEALGEKFPYRSYIENPVKAAAMAESLFGEAQDIPDFLMIEFGSGMGAAVMMNGKLYRGRNNMVGEVGHIMVEPGGTLCDCGRRGCLQNFACISGIEKRAGRPFGNVLAQAAAGDEHCRKVLDDTVYQCGMWLANLANFYNPSLTLVYGELFSAWPRFFDRIVEQHKPFVWAPLGHPLQIRKSELLMTSHGIIASASIVFCQNLLSTVDIEYDQFAY